MLESKLKEEGAFVLCSPNFTPHVVVDGHLITGQNPQSSVEIGKAIKRAVNKIIVILISAHFFLLMGMSSFSKKMEQ